MKINLSNLIKLGIFLVVPNTMIYKSQPVSAQEIDTNSPTWESHSYYQSANSTNSPARFDWMNKSIWQPEVKNISSNKTVQIRKDFKLQSRFKIDDARLTIDGCFVDRQFHSAEQATKGLSRNINDKFQEYTPFRFSGDFKKGAKITFYESIGKRYELGSESFFSSFLDLESYKVELSAKATPYNSDYPEKATGGGLFIRKKF